MRIELWYDRKWIWPQTRPFGTSGGSIILIGAAGAPTGNWPLSSEVCSLLVLVNSDAVTVVPTVPRGVPRGDLAVIQ